MNDFWDYNASKIQLFTAKAFKIAVKQEHFIVLFENKLEKYNEVVLSYAYVVLKNFFSIGKVFKYHISVRVEQDFKIYIKTESCTNYD